MFIPTDPETITRTRIKGLHHEAVIAGDIALMEVCETAIDPTGNLESVLDALAIIARVLDDARAQEEGA